MKPIFRWPPVVVSSVPCAPESGAGTPPWSITRRVALYCTLFAGIAVACLLAVVYWDLSGALRDRAHAELVAERDILLKSLAALPGAEALQDENAMQGLRTEHAGLDIAVLPLRGAQPIVAIGAEVHELLALDLSGESSAIREVDQPHSLLAVAVERAWLRDGNAVRVAIALDRTSDRTLLVNYRWRLALMGLGAIGLIGALAGLIARGSLGRLRTFTVQVATISAARLGRRIDAASVPIELRELATTFNDLLSRLEDAFRRLDTFAADMAHELRSPVANLVTRTHIALSRPREKQEYLAALESNAEELERLRRMVDDMLLLARAENPATSIARAPIDLRRVCDELAEFYQLSAEERALSIEVSGEGSAIGDPDLVRRAIGNLVSNALRHARPSTSVRLTVERDALGRACVKVINAGAGIGAELRPQLFARFVRGGAPQTPANEPRGAGLGLAIVRSIMQLHGGAVGVDGTPSGLTTFWLKFGESAPC